MVTLQIPDRAIAHILEPELITALGALVAHGPDQAGAPLARKREDGEKIGLVEVGVQFAVNGRSRGRNVGDIKQLAVGSPGESGAHRVAHLRSRAVAAGDIRGLNRLALAVGPAKLRDHPTAILPESDELRSPLDRNPHRLQPLDEQAFVLILRKDAQIWVWSEAHAARSKSMRAFFTPRAQRLTAGTLWALSTTASARSS